MKQKKFLLAFLLLFAVMATTLLSVYGTAYVATTIDEDRQALDELRAKAEYNKQQQAELQNKIATLDGQYDNLLDQKIDLDHQISLLNDEIELTEQLIENYNITINDLNAKLTETQDKISDYYEIYGQMLCFYYEYGEAGTLEMLLQSSDISDFLMRVDYINYMMEYNGKITEQITSTKNALADQKSTYEEYREALEEYMADRQSAQDALTEKTEEIKPLIQQIAANKEEYENIQYRYEDEEDTYAQMIGSLQSQLDQKIETSIADESSRIAASIAASAAAASQAAEQSRYLESLSKEEPSSGTTVTASAGTWPIPKSYWSILYCSSGYGWRTNPFTATGLDFHKGMDFPAPAGTPILAIESGTVIRSEFSGSFGNIVVIAHSSGYSSLYCHASARLVSVGDKVVQGQVIAKVGTTGSSTGNHLHLGIIVNGSYVNPMPYISTEFKRALGLA